MSKLQFTPEQVRAFQRSPYVARVSEKSISFTQSFKLLAYAELQTGKPMSQIFTDHGIDTSALGAVRVMKFKQNLTKDANREGGFRDLRKPDASKNEAEELRRTLEQLEQQLAHTTRTIEYLKKLQNP